MRSVPRRNIETRPDFFRVIAVLMTLAAVCCGSVPALADECAPFYESLNDAGSVAQNGGVVTGTLTFSAGVNNDAGSFNGATSVLYTDSVFAAAEGSFTFWFRKNSADGQGGILEIGNMGSANSIGALYRPDGSIACEIRNSTGGRRTAATGAGVVSESTWTHIAVLWKRGSGFTNVWMFVNGYYVTYTSLPGDFNPASQLMRVGATSSYGFAEGLIDELRMFDWSLRDDEVYAEYVFSSDRFNRQTSTKPVSTGPVQLIDGELFVEGKPFKVKGVGYQPMPIGEWPSDITREEIYTDPAILSRDMALLRAMHVNTIRTWAQVPDEMLLDACYNSGVDPIYVIMGYWVPLDVDYGNAATVASIKASFVAHVNEFKDHPAVLGWGIGNENNYAYGGDLADWYALANDLCEVAYLAEGATYHPSIVVNGGLRELGNVDLGSDDVSMSFLDIWGLNAYPGEDFYCTLDYYARITARPLVFTEYGIDAYNNQTGVEYQDMQAAYVVAQWRQLSKSSLGGSVMAYSDEWWKADDPWSHDWGGYGTRMHPDGYSNEEWWGMVAVQDNGSGPDIMLPRQVYYDLGAEFGRFPGDMDCNEFINGRDIAAFALAIVDPAAYETAYPDCDVLNADLSGDYEADALDVAPFIEALLAVGGEM